MATSRNLITQDNYQIPENLDDSIAIKDFLSNNRGKKVIVVQGLGFVGAVMSLVCANALTEEYAVIGIDLANENTFWKIKSINSKKRLIMQQRKRAKRHFQFLKMPS